MPSFSSRTRLVLKVTGTLVVLVAVGLGVSLGLALAATRNIETLEAIGDFQPALPTQVLDIHGRLITKFFSEEKREIAAIDELPKHLVYALITREDQEFFNHNGFSLRGTLRAVFNLLTGQYFSGGSTITQQLAGHLYADRSDISVTRKLVELWWAFQLERSLTKYEILEKYLNKMYFGAGVYGVEAASQFYFGHSARELTLAESVVLVIQLASPVRYSPINQPNRLKRLQYEVLQQMVKLGYADKAEAEFSFEDYWNNYDFSRTSAATAFFEREDQAPYFSEYIRQQLEEILHGSLDIYRDGLIVHTTLNLDYQRVADEQMARGIAQVNADYQTNTDRHVGIAEQDYVPIVDLLSLSFDIPNLRSTGAKENRRAQRTFREFVNPTVDLVSMLFGINELKYAARVGYASERKSSKMNTVEGALITIDNNTGHILAMVGGSRFESINQFNRAVQAEVQPGSAFKPLYYAAAVEAKRITPATMLYDAPVVFWNDDGTPYTPMNFRGEWQGPVLVRNALARSMNVPSLKVLDLVGFDTAIETSAKLLGVDQPDEIARIFPRKYPLGLGIIRVAPVQMARAFSAFANGGREVVPISIRYIEDRNGKIILEPERDLIAAQRKKGRATQLLSPQTAYVMTDMLQSTLDSGTLSYAKNYVRGFSMPMAGKTGTTQNWSDAWTVGYSPYYTTAVWFGFDRPGNSLGVSSTGALTAGPVWAAVMKAIHTGLEPRSFVRPDGLVDVVVTARAGLLPPSDYARRTIRELFIAGTEPRRFDDFAEFEEERNRLTVDRIYRAILPQDLGADSAGVGHLPLDQDALPTLSIDRSLLERPSTGAKENPLLD